MPSSRLAIVLVKMLLQKTWTIWVFLVQPGLYVLGLINQSAASRAGVTQGDQILEIDGVTLKNETPFQAASLIQGPETGPRNPTVTLKVFQVCFCRKLHANQHMFWDLSLAQLNVWKATWFRRAWVCRRKSLTFTLWTKSLQDLAQCFPASLSHGNYLVATSRLITLGKG